MAEIRKRAMSAIRMAGGCRGRWRAERVVWPDKGDVWWEGESGGKHWLEKVKEVRAGMALRS